MRELDVVRLKEEFKGLPTGTEGTIVAKVGFIFFQALVRMALSFLHRVTPAFRFCLATQP